MGVGETFVADLRQALSAWRSDPRLPFVSTWLYVVTSIPAFFPLNTTTVGQTINLALLPFSLFYLGYVGTERLWYLRIWRNEEMTLAHTWHFSWQLMKRFLALGFLVMLFFIPTLIWSIVEVVREIPRLTAEIESGLRQGEDREALTRSLEAGLLPPALLIINYVIIVVVDVCLTFVTPALTFTTYRATEAIKIGLRTLRDTWPHSSLYALIPPLAALVTLRFLPHGTLSLGVHIALTTFGALLLVLFKGATVAFYVRSHPDIPDTGATGQKRPSPYEYQIPQR